MTPGGVAIILSPPAAEAWIATGSKPQITTQMVHASAAGGDRIMVLRHNQDERAIGTKGRIPGGVAIILYRTAAKVWIAAGSKPQITTPIDSPFVGRFIRAKIRYQQINH